jgi:2-dehydropantoate 2-reductase
MKLAVIGSGGLGGYFGFRLAQGGNEIHFIARGPHLEAMRSNGLHLITGEENTIVKVNATDDPSSIGKVELVLFCVKTYDTIQAAKAILPILNESTSILTLQNGVDNFDIISGIVGEGRVLPASALIVSEIQSPGTIHVSSKIRKVIFGEMDGTSTERAEKIFQLFNDAKIETQLSNEIGEVLWRKMVWICGMAGMTTLLREPLGKILSDPDSRDMFRIVMEEVAELARSKGFDIGGAEFASKQVSFADSLEKDLTSSMMRDLLSGRRLELEALNGAIVRIGREHGIPTPMNLAIYVALKPFENGKQVINK